MKAELKVRNLRAAMPVTNDYAYFDHAAVGPLTQPARIAVQDWLDQASTSGDLHWLDWSAAIEKLRRDGASLLHTTADQIALIPNTSFGINTVATGWNWKAGQNVIVAANEFPSNFLPWKSLHARGVEMRTILPQEDGTLAVDHLINAIDSRTAMISVSWVGYATGYKIDLGELIERAHQKDVLVFVDAIQGLGAYPVDVENLNIDFLAADGHKWLLGPEGAGLLYVAKRHLDSIHPAMIGWNSIDQTEQFSNESGGLKKTAAKYEFGSNNTAGLLGLGASLNLLLQLGCHESSSGFADAILDVADYADERLRHLGASVDRNYNPAHRTGIVSFKFPGVDCVSFRKACIAENIILSVRHHRLRIAPHAYCTHEDVDRLLSCVTKFRKKE